MARLGRFRSASSSVSRSVGGPWAAHSCPTAPIVSAAVIRQTPLRMRRLRARQAGDEHVLERRRHGRTGALASGVDASAALNSASAPSPPSPSVTCTRSPKTCASTTPGKPREGRRPPSAPGAMTSSIRPVMSVRSRAGSSMASTRPSCSSATRVQRSASSRYGVDIRMVMPCARNSDSSFQNSRRETGSTPVVGSSSRISSARGRACRRARASASCRPTAGRPAGRETASAASSPAADRAAR